MNRKYSYHSLMIILVLSGMQLNLFAQDDPCTATPLSVGTTCAAISIDNTGATNSSVPNAVCDGGTSDGDIWVSAIVGANGTLIIKTTPGTLTDVGMAIYTGSSCSSLTLNSCVAGGSPGFPNMPYKSLSGLPANSEVWIRIWDVGNDETGTINICAYVNCNASVNITGPTSGCTANPAQLCTSGSFSSYSWTGGATTSCINVNATGTYTVTVTDADGCTATDSQSFTANTSPTVSISGPSSGCSANNPQLCVPFGFINYTWSNGGTVRCISPASTGTYIVTVTAANGCTASDSQPITINTSPTISITGPPSKCSDSNDQLCVSTGFSTYAWSNGGTANCITPSTSASYSVVVTNSSGCTASDSQFMTVHSAPSITVSGPATACPGSNPQFCVSGGFSSYSWSNGGTINCISPSTSGIYTVTVTDGFGCTASNSKSITIFPASTVTITGPSNVCSGLPAQLCTPSGFTAYNWSTSATTNCITPSASGTYTVIVTDGNGCTASDNHVFTLDTLPPSTISGPSSTCNGASAQLCAPAGNSFYLWSNNSTSSCISASSSGTYSVVVTGANGCTSSSTHSLTVFPIYAMSITGPSTACSGANTQLCATAGNYTYQWSNGATTACINPAVSGTYSVVSTNINGCTRTASKGLTVYSPLNASVTGPSSACIGSVVPLCGPSGSTSYTWSTGQTTECININSNGLYVVVISDIHGCTASASQQVTFSSSFSVDITGPVSGCNGSSAILCVPSGYSSYAWNTGETSECITVDSAGNYSVTVHDQVGCVANNFYSIPFNPPPVVNITGSSIICTGSLALWCATSGFPSYLWSNGGTAECINVTQDTTYTVQVTDLNGCSGTVSRTLIVVHLSPSIFESNNQLICDTFNLAYRYSWLINGSNANCFSDTCTPTFSAIYSVIVTDTVSGCSETATYNYINNGISNFSNGASVNLFPNPFYGNDLQIEFRKMTSENTSVKIFNAIGSQVYNDAFLITSDRFIQTIDLSGQAAGIYYVSIQNKTGVAIKKIIKS